MSAAIMRQIAEIGLRTSDAALQAGLSGETVGFEKPKMKLTTPFAIAHLVGEGRTELLHLTLSPAEARA
jgi:hypothetical protein